MGIDELNTEATKNETLKETEKSEILDSFLNQIGEPNKSRVNDVFANDEKLKGGFKYYLEFGNIEDEEEAIIGLSKCETPVDVLNFIKEHQGHKIGNDAMKERKETTEEKEQTTEEKEQTTEEKEQTTEEKEQTTEEKEQTTEEKEQTTEEKEQTTEEKEQTTEEKEQTTEEKEQITEEKEQITKGKERVSNIVKFQEKVSEAIQNRDELLNSNLEPKKAADFDIKTRKKAEEFKNKLSEGTKNQLVEKYGDKTINDYILLRVTLNEVKNDSSFDASAVKNFESKVNELSSMDIFLKNIDNECKIADTRLSSFSKENIGQTRTELFNDDIGNQSLIEARNNNKENRDYSEVFHEISEEDLIRNYGKLLEGISKDFLNKYQTDSNFKILTDNARKVKNNPDATNQDKQLGTLYDNMIKELNSKKIDVEEKTKDMMEEMCLITQINAMAKCIGQESFSLNKANEIKYDETGAMVLDGHIDGVNFSVRHNFDEDWSYLQTSSKLVKAENTNANNPENKSLIKIGGEGRFENSPFKLPGKESIFGMVSDVVASTEFSGENFDSVDDYIDNMQEGIVGKMDDVFDKDAEAANDYMKGQIKREEAIQETDKFIRNFEDGLEFTGIVNSSNKKLYDFLNIMNFNIKNIKNPEKSEEMNKLIEVMRRINKIAELGKSNSKASELNNHADNFGKYLTGDSLLNTRKILKNENVDDKTPSAFDLFKNYKKENDSRNIGELYMLDFQQIDRTLNVVETTSAIVADAKKSGSEADDLLKNASSLWPPDSTVSMA